MILGLRNHHILGSQWAFLTSQRFGSFIWDSLTFRLAGSWLESWLIWFGLVWSGGLALLRLDLRGKDLQVDGLLCLERIFFDGWKMLEVHNVIGTCLRSKTLRIRNTSQHLLRMVLAVLILPVGRSFSHFRDASAC